MRYLPDHEMRDVRDLHRKFQLTVGEDGPQMLDRQKAEERHNFLEEELLEFYQAMANEDFAGMADALVDLVYVAKGTAVMMGLPWEELWDDVQRANMAKRRGVTERGHDEDLVKPEGWKPPQTEMILKANGWKP